MSCLIGCLIKNRNFIIENLFINEKEGFLCNNSIYRVVINNSRPYLFNLKSTYK